MNRSRMIHKRHLPLLCAAMALVAGAGGVRAESPSSTAEPEQMAIAYDDLDLTSEEGRAALQSRVDRGIDKACLMNRSAPTLRKYIEQKRMAQRCKARAQMQSEAHIQLAVEASLAKSRLASAEAVRTEMPK
ncbi:UrcA family protein [Erythrobacter ani]|uniref:UrcA family protein n=1 Tax=Erythrobacter ani TaxID=2827235 RepID=A0ABS6SK83_9SPHN|nr:UrcA family protein [Erythrobacter ani]MBV7264932.1 UrcA family protein [Erythrobacter ani]